MIINSWDINSELKICHVEKFDDSFNDLVKEQFDNKYPILRWRDSLSEERRDQVKTLNSQLSSREKINIGLFEGDRIVGWSYGWQGGIESACFYMANSFIHPDYRNQGLYTQLLNKVIQIATEKGFQSITSRHLASNNPVLIAKLKAGFKITGMELSEIHGNLIHLTYFMNELRSESFEVRCGGERPKSEALRNLFFYD